MKSMEDLFLHFLQDIYYAEKQGLKALAKVGKAAENEEFKQFVEGQREQGQHHVESLEQVFGQLDKRPRGKTCAAMNGLIEEVREAISEGEKGPVLDAALIAGVQAMKHYEIARLGALEAWAKQMGMDEAADLLGGLVEQDKDADEELTRVAEDHANPEASETNEDDDDDEEEDDEDEDGTAAADEEDDEDDEAAEEGEQAVTTEERTPARATRSRAPASRKKG